VNEIERIERYISRTSIKPTKAAAGADEILALAESLEPFMAASLAFMYGRAKGYRAGKAEVRK